MIYKTILIYSIDCSNKQYKYAIVYFIMNDWKNKNPKSNKLQFYINIVFCHHKKGSLSFIEIFEDKNTVQYVIIINMEFLLLKQSL